MGTQVWITSKFFFNSPFIFAGNKMGQLPAHLRSSNPLVQSDQLYSHRHLPMCYGRNDSSPNRIARRRFLVPLPYYTNPSPLDLAV